MGHISQKPTQIVFGRCKQKICYFFLSPFATEARNALALQRFVMIIAQVKLFQAVTQIEKFILV